MLAYSAGAENNVSFLWLIFFIRISEARRRASLVRNMEIAELRSMFQSVQSVPSASGGAGGTSSRCVHSTSGGRVVADSAVRLSAIPGNVSGEELLASSSHRASTQVADLSASRVLDVSGVNATSSPVADLESRTRDRSGKCKVSARELVLFRCFFFLTKYCTFCCLLFRFA